MTKSERRKKKDLQTLGITSNRGPIFVGCRSTVFNSAKHDKKASRRKDKVRTYEWN